MEEVHEALKLPKLILSKASVAGNGSNVTIRLRGTVNPRKREPLLRIFEAAEALVLVRGDYDGDGYRHVVVPLEEPLDAPPGPGVPRVPLDHEDPGLPGL